MVEKVKHYERLKFSFIIFSLLILIFFKPQGLINWASFEDKNYIVAVERGHILKLKSNNRLKFISSSQDFYFGSYNMKDDTLFLSTEKETPYMDRISYATLQNYGDTLNSYRTLCLYQNFATRSGRCITMHIRDLELDSLAN